MLLNPLPFQVGQTAQPAGFEGAPPPSEGPSFAQVLFSARGADSGDAEPGTRAAVLPSPLPEVVSSVAALPAQSGRTPGWILDLPRAFEAVPESGEAAPETSGLPIWIVDDLFAASVDPGDLIAGNAFSAQGFAPQAEIAPRDPAEDSSTHDRRPPYQPAAAGELLPIIVDAAPVVEGHDAGAAPDDPLPTDPPDAGVETRDLFASRAPSLPNHLPVIASGDTFSPAVTAAAPLPEARGPNVSSAGDPVPSAPARPRQAGDAIAPEVPPGVDPEIRVPQSGSGTIFPAAPDRIPSFPSMAPAESAAPTPLFQPVPQVEARPAPREDRAPAAAGPAPGADLGPDISPDGALGGFLTGETTPSGRQAAPPPGMVSAFEHGGSPDAVPEQQGVVQHIVRPVGRKAHETPAASPKPATANPAPLAAVVAGEAETRRPAVNAERPSVPPDPPAVNVADPGKPEAAGPKWPAAGNPGTVIHRSEEGAQPAASRQSETESGPAAPVFGDTRSSARPAASVKPDAPVTPDASVKTGAPATPDVSAQTSPQRQAPVTPVPSYELRPAPVEQRTPSSEVGVSTSTRPEQTTPVVESVIPQNRESRDVARTGRQEPAGRPSVFQQSVGPTITDRPIESVSGSTLESVSREDPPKDAWEPDAAPEVAPREQSLAPAEGGRLREAQLGPPRADGHAPVEAVAGLRDGGARPPEATAHVSTPTTPDVPVDDTHVTRQIVRAAHFLTRDGQTRVTLRLDPPDLGEVTVDLTTGDRNLTGEIRVANRAVHDLVQRNLPELREALQAQGIQVDRLDVSVDDQGRGAAQREAFANLMDRRPGREGDSSNFNRNGRPAAGPPERESVPQNGQMQGRVDFVA